jgi:hypothetical protein
VEYFRIKSAKKEKKIQKEAKDRRELAQWEQEK